MVFHGKMTRFPWAADWMREFSNSINMVSNLCSRGSTRILGVGKSPRYTQQCQTHAGVVFLLVGLSGFFIWFIASRTLVHISSTNQWMKPHNRALEDDSLFHFGAILRLFSHFLVCISPLEYNQRTVLTTVCCNFLSETLSTARVSNDKCRVKWWHVSILDNVWDVITFFLRQQDEHAGKLAT